MRRTLLFLAALLVFPATAAAESPRAIQVSTGIQLANRTYVLKGQRVVLRGARPFADSGFVTATVMSHGHQVVARSKLRGKVGVVGGVQLHFTARRTGTYKVAIRVFRDTDPKHLVAGKLIAVHVVDPHVGAGSHGLGVKLLQKGLHSLAYVTPQNGSFGPATGRAVLAFRKTNNMARTMSADHSVLAKLFRHQGGFTLKYPNAGKHVEFDWSRQVLVFAEGGRPVRIYHASSGKPSTPTVFGTFHFYSKTPGTNAKGMVDSNYFIRGYAIHGYAEVPPYAASHGCIRVPIPDAASIYSWISLGDTIFIYP
jgi:L,D-transpeptidase catalytic domain